MDYCFKKIFSSTVTQRRVFLFYFFSGVTVFTFVFSPICQNILYRKYCLRCHSDLKQVFVLLRGGESHCIWRRLSLAQLSLLSGFQRKGGGGGKCQRATTLRLRPIFPRLHMWESCHVHSSTASWALWKELMLCKKKKKKKMFRRFIIIIENAYEHQQQNITHIFLSSGAG